MTADDGYRYPDDVSAAEFKRICAKLADEISNSSGELVLTRYGRAVARMSNFPDRSKTLFGSDEGKLEIFGDIVSPIDVEWEAEVDPDRVLDPSCR